jgi:hypothetical protein
MSTISGNKSTTCPYREKRKDASDIVQDERYVKVR